MFKILRRLFLTLVSICTICTLYYLGKINIMGLMNISEAEHTEDVAFIISNSILPQIKDESEHSEDNIISNGIPPEINNEIKQNEDIISNTSIPPQIKDEADHSEDIPFITSNSNTGENKDESEHIEDIASVTSNSNTAENKDESEHTEEITFITSNTSIPDKIISNGIPPQIKHESKHIENIPIVTSNSNTAENKDESEHIEDIAIDTSNSNTAENKDESGNSEDIISNSIPPQIKDKADHTEDVAFVLSNGIPPENFTRDTSAFPIDNLPLNDSSQLLNITNFKFLINPTCSQSPYIVVVSSAPGNYHKRHLIRSTWGLGVPLYFFFGETANNQTLLDTESAEYHDVVQGSFIDSYRNLTYKDMLVFKWVIYNCPRVRYVLKIDDDVFVNVARFSEFLTDALSPYGTRHLLMCYVWRHIAVDRSNNMSKFYVSVEEYPYEEYPPYCSGPTVLYSPDVLFKLYQSLQQDGNYFWIEDVFVTGIMVSKLNLKHAEFNWWKGNDWLLVTKYEDLFQYDPGRNLFVMIGEPIYEQNGQNLVEYFLNVTSDHSGNPV